MDWTDIHITDGTGQQDRDPDAFAPGYFNIDEHSFETLLSMGAEFAEVMKFYNLRNRIEGNWGELFNNDEAVVMAVILSVNLKKIEADFDNIPADHTVELLQYMLHLAREINQWLLRLSASPHKSGELLASKIEMLIEEKLAVQLHNIYTIERQAGIPWVEQDATRFATVWDLDAAAGDALLTRATIDPLSADDSIKEQLGKSFQISRNSISYLKSAAAACLPQSLQSQQHEPSVGLFITFLKLYEKAQGQLNRFTLRHLDFYYRKILQAENWHQMPKSCYLLLESQAASGRLLIAKGAGFNAGQDAELNDIIYTADDELLVSDARLETQATLYLEHDKLISPESDLDFVTRIKADRPGITDAESTMDSSRDHPASWALFGAESQYGAEGSATDARIGLSVATPVLLLEQGIRRIDLTIELESTLQIELDSQISELLICELDQEFSQKFGKLFMRCLLKPADCLESDDKDKIAAKAASLLPERLAREVSLLLKQDWQGNFYKLFKKAFCIDLTTEDGWFEVQNYYMQPLADMPKTQTSGFRITLELGQEVAPITAYNADVHGGQLQTDLPVLQCLINPQSSFFSYSAFQDLLITSLHIEVDVSDVRNLLVYNQHGQLDPSKPFQPFGPAPDGSSYFVFGNYELARKKLQQIKIDLDWGGLPLDMGGFEEFYRGYDRTYHNNSFQVSFSALVDSRWLPEGTALRPRFSLFETRVDSNRVDAHKEIKIEPIEYVKPIEASVAEADYRYDLKSRKGYFRLSLVAPETGFGHGEYGGLLTRGLTANLKLKITKQKPMPNVPYTPTLNGIALSYRASTTINPARVVIPASSAGAKIFHLHPFGVETVFPPTPASKCYLLPQYKHEGNLFLGLSGKSITGPLSLLFHLSKDRAQAASGKNNTFDWFYLAANRWCDFPLNSILSDSTHGFLAPGIVTLNIPAEISKGNSVMPGDYYWLRVSVNRGAAAFPSCYSIRPHALKVTRSSEGEQAVEPDPAILTKWSPVTPIPGLDSIKQAYPAFGGRSAESDKHLRRRISERLRHKNRASMPWDYEQMILERFPEIIKVKCFNSMSSTEDRIKPGQVLIVVVPGAGLQSGASCAHEMIDSRKLDQIRTYVKKRCSEFAQIEVRNPQYELVQVRCTVKFDDVAREGDYVKRLNQDISDYICPWKSGGYRTRFGWSIRQQDIESYIFELGYVEMVTNFSMLHITVDKNDDYSLLDTVNEKLKSKAKLNPKAVIKPCYPWSLALPVEKHFIETTQDSESIEAEITGIDELAVGGTFIIVGSSENGETD